MKPELLNSSSTNRAACSSAFLSASVRASFQSASCSSLVPSASLDRPTFICNGKTSEIFTTARPGTRRRAGDEVSANGAKMADRRLNPAEQRSLTQADPQSLGGESAPETTPPTSTPPPAPCSGPAPAWLISAVAQECVYFGAQTPVSTVLLPVSDPRRRGVHGGGQALIHFRLTNAGVCARVWQVGAGADVCVCVCFSNVLGCFCAR